MIERLITALNALAAPVDVQLTRLPPFVQHADELAREFGDAYGLVSDCPQVELTAGQRDVLRHIDTRLDALSGSWTARALRTSADWAELRRLASDALRLLGAPVERSHV